MECNKKQLEKCVLNLNTLNDSEFFIDHNMNSPSNFLDGVAEFLIEPLLQIKKIVNTEGHPHVVKANGIKLKILALHFQGGAKKYLQRVFKVRTTFPLLFIDLLIAQYFKMILKILLKYIKSLKSCGIKSHTNR